MLSPAEIQVIKDFQNGVPGWGKLELEELTTCLLIARELGRPLRFICERLVTCKEDMVARNQPPEPAPAAAPESAG